MYCLFNGEYGEHDLSHVSGLSKKGGILDSQKEQYQHYIGMVVGDFTCLEVEYDWGRRDQRWKIKCNLCGVERYQYHTADWKRGKGRTLLCECRKAKREKEAKMLRAAQLYEQKQKKEESENAAIQMNREKYVGAVFNGWEIVDCFKNDKCSVKCSQCGREIARRRKICDVVNGNIKRCKCPKDYSGDEWIGKRNEHLVVIGRSGSMFVCKCDCGNKRTVRPVELFTYKTAKSCNENNCPYTRNTQLKAREIKYNGDTWEYNVYARLTMKGYNTELVAKTGDFGVDIIITEEDGSKIAIQCKNQSHPTGVRAIQEVYAGGRFYDCTKFAVISASPYSNNAIVFAKKLGVYLSDENFSYPKDIDKYCASLLPTHNYAVERSKKYYEIDGEKHTVGEWCLKYKIKIGVVRRRLRNGIDLKTALTTPENADSVKNVYTVNGYTGTIPELSLKYNINPATVRYRMSQRNMTLEEALTAPKQVTGRPHKEETIKEAI